MKNLKALGDVIDELIASGTKVEMDEYLRGDYPNRLDLDQAPECGAVGCILGHCSLQKSGPLAPTLDAPIWCPTGELNYDRYALWVFGASKLENHGVWDWMFSSMWPDSAEHAKKRLELLIAHGGTIRNPAQYAIMHKELNE